MRILYLGTPEFAVPTLEKLLSWDKGNVVGVVTQPDRPAGRGNKIVKPPTKLVAERYGLPVLQPEKLAKAADTVQAMRNLRPDVLVMVAFGQILKQEVLQMAPLRVVNLHGSILPKYRGAAPINWAIINGEKTTGVTTMFSDAGVDTGPMLLKTETPIDEDMTAEELAEKLSHIGANLIIETLEGLHAGTLKSSAQDDCLATMAPRLSKETGKIDWTRSAAEIHNLVRGLYPWPGTHTEVNSGTLKIIKTKLIPAGTDVAIAPSIEKSPGTILDIHGTMKVACGPGGSEIIELLEVQPPNKPKMSARDFANGAHIAPGAVLGASRQSVPPV